MSGQEKNATYQERKPAPTVRERPRDNKHRQRQQHDQDAHEHGPRARPLNHAARESYVHVTLCTRVQITCYFIKNKKHDHGHD